MPVLINVRSRPRPSASKGSAAGKEIKASGLNAGKSILMSSSRILSVYVCVCVRVYAHACACSFCSHMKDPFLCSRISFPQQQKENHIIVKMIPIMAL